MERQFRSTTHSGSPGSHAIPRQRRPARTRRSAAAKITATAAPESIQPSGQPLPFNNYAVTPAATPYRPCLRFPSITSSLLAIPFLCATRFRTRRQYRLDIRSTARWHAAQAGHRAIRTSASDPREDGRAWINDVRIGVNRGATSLTQADYGQNLAEQLGIPGVNRDRATSGPSLAIAGLFNLGGSLWPLQLASTTWGGEKTLAKGRHALRAADCSTG
jgi:hypothetical protein